MKPSFVALDFEISNASHASICSVGVVRVVDGEVTKQLSCHIRPPAPYDYVGSYQRKLAKLDDHAIANGADFATIAPVMISSIGNGIVVGHGVRTADLSMFTQSWFAAGLPGPFPALSFVCTQELARDYVPGLPHYGLKSVYDHLFDEPMRDHHDPSADALASARIVTALVDDHRVLEARARVRNSVPHFNLKPLKPSHSNRPLPPRSA